jgi:hypothetical protein
MTTFCKSELLSNLSAEYINATRHLDSDTVALIEKEDGSAALLKHPGSSTVKKAVELRRQILELSK